MKDKNIRLFPLTDKDVRTEYPELGAVEEFKKLSAKEMLFVWYFANKTSKFYPLPERARAIKCLALLKKELSAQALQQYSQLEFPDHLKLAIDRMEKFNPEIRNQAKTIVETIFENIKQIVSADITKMDIEDKQKYVSLSVNITKNMSDMVVQIENGYGVRDTGKKEAAADTSDDNIWDSVKSESE